MHASASARTPASPAPPSPAARVRRRPRPRGSPDPSAQHSLRRQYWWFFLFYTLAYIVAIIIDSVIGTPFILTIIVVLAIFIPALAVGVRRLHDTGKSGWWYFISLIPFIGGIWLLVLLVQTGTPGQNQYGPPPQAFAAA